MYQISRTLYYYFFLLMHFFFMRYTHPPFIYRKKYKQRNKTPQPSRYRKGVPLLGNICSCGMGQLTSMCYIDAKKDKKMLKIPQSCRYCLYTKAVVGWKVFPLPGNICFRGMGQPTSIYFTNITKDKQKAIISHPVAIVITAIVGREVFPLLKIISITEDIPSFVFIRQQ